MQGFDLLAPKYIGKDMSKVLDWLSKAKLDKYETHGKMKYPDLQMKALIFDTLGGLSAPAICVMKTISKSGHLSSLSSNRDPVKIANHAIASITVAICDCFSEFCN